MKTEEIVFLESEIVEDDAHAPVGTLVKRNKPKTAVKTPAKPAPQQAPAGRPAPQQTASDQQSSPQEHRAWTQTLANEPATQEQLSSSYFGNGIVIKTVKKDEAPQKKSSPATKANLNPWAEAEAKAAAKKRSSQSAQKSQTKAPKTQNIQQNSEEPDMARDEKPKAATQKAEPVKTTPSKPEQNDVKSEPKKAKPATKPETAEKVLVEGDTSKPHGKFVIKKTDNGNFVYKLYSSNFRVLASPGGAYKDLSSCKSGIQSVINNAATAPIEDTTLKKYEEQKCPKWVIYNDKAGEVRLRLIASNGNVVAITNDGYTTKDAAKKGIDAIARAAAGASIVRNDDLW